MSKNKGSYVILINPNISTYIFTACDLLGSFMDQVNGDYQKAFKLYQTACDEYKYGHSCQKAGSYLYAGRAVPRDIVIIIMLIVYMILTTYISPLE